MNFELIFGISAVWIGVGLATLLDQCEQMAASGQAPVIGFEGKTAWCLTVLIWLAITAFWPLLWLSRLRGELK